MKAARTARIGALLVATLSVACAGRTDAARERTVTDSAGVTIVETRAETWPLPDVWTVDEAPTVDIGVRDGDPDYELFQVTGARSLADGTIVLVEFGSRLRSYDADGVHLRTLERNGMGPGEAEMFTDLDLYRGDSIAITTGRMQGQRNLTTVMILAADGSFGRNIEVWNQGSAPRSDTMLWSNTPNTGQVAALENGRFITMGSTAVDLTGPEGTIVDGRMALLQSNALGEFTDTIDVVQASQYERRTVDNRRYELLLDEATASPVRTLGNRAWFAAGEHPIVNIYEPDTTGALALTRAWRVNSPAIASSDASRERYIEAVLAVSGGPDVADRQAYRDRLESLRSPDRLPAVQDLVVDAIGNVWLEMYDSVGKSVRVNARSAGLALETRKPRWIVFDSTGTLLGSVQTPIGLEIQEIGADYLLGLWFDEFGVQHVRRYAIRKR